MFTLFCSHMVREILAVYGSSLHLEPRSPTSNATKTTSDPKVVAARHHLAWSLFFHWGEGPGSGGRLLCLADRHYSCDTAQG